MVAFRGLVDLLFRRMIPWPSLFGLESQQHREEDVLGRRRAWFWHFWLRIGVTVALIVTVIWLFRGGSWFGAFGSIGHGAGRVLSYAAALDPGRLRLLPLHRQLRDPVRARSS